MDWLDRYQTLPGIPDELIDRQGDARGHWLRFLSGLAQASPREMDEHFALATRHIRDTGVSYRIYGEEGEQSWRINPLPLILSHAEWLDIEEGVAQRAELMEAVLKDLYGPARLVSEGHLPAAVVTGGADFVRPLRGSPPPGGRYLHLYAADLGRGPDGRWWVLDDRTQAPSGAGYALENRLVLSRAYPQLYAGMNVERLAPFFGAFRDGLAASAERAEPRICLLTPGPYSETYFEQAHLARYLGFLLVEGEDLVVREGKAHVRTIAGLKRADVLWRRVDADFVDPLELNSASRLGVPGLLEAIRAGGVVVTNLPGSGLVESRALLGFLPALARQLLGQDLKLPNIATWWCGQPRERDLVEANIDNLAIAGAFRGPGRGPASAGPRLLADLEPAEREALRAAMHDRPLDFVGQEVVRLSTMPAWRDGGISAKPFVLRVYAAATADGGWKIMPGGFCRISDKPDARAVTMGEGVESADVWVLSDRPVPRVSLMAPKDKVHVRRIPGDLPSRAADNLFWLGRYLERAEATLRLVRGLKTSLMESEATVRGAGETLGRIQGMLVAWGALDKKAADSPPTEAAIRAVGDGEAYGSVMALVRSARRAASSTRERLSADFWKLLVELENRLSADQPGGKTEVLDRVEGALQAISALTGLSQDNMIRGDGWRFLDMARRIERGVNTCRVMRQFASEDPTADDLDVLLDLVDSQITYRARYLEGMAVVPVRDLVMLDPFNPRSVAFQVARLTEHLQALPRLRNDGMIEEPLRLALKIAGEIDSEEAARLDAKKALALEQRLMQLSDALAARYFLQGSSATPTKKTSALA
ncbi:circularly permuted type 2 ATP-grasp protein [Phenylobacterium montanum]|uniref:Circularly permuted type 2 ATP-grasp protein n=2 Tax=Phenylobacterium montanum TaxID=2823693 RepID=A0A975G5D1_9CAUL|nr:circularly permuted type 2 ATP-grasp protein [Caulobacter sp. S6]